MTRIVAYAVTYHRQIKLLTADHPRPRPLYTAARLTRPEMVRVSAHLHQGLSPAAALWLVAAPYSLFASDPPPLRCPVGLDGFPPHIPDDWYPDYPTLAAFAQHQLRQQFAEVPSQSRLRHDIRGLALQARERGNADWFNYAPGIVDLLPISDQRRTDLLCACNV